MPLTRTYSLPLLSVISFWPATSIFPFGKTRVTVTANEPVKLFDWAALPVPAKVLFVPAVKPPPFTPLSSVANPPRQNIWQASW